MKNTMSFFVSFVEQNLVMRIWQDTHRMAMEGLAQNASMELWLFSNTTKTKRSIFALNAVSQASGILTLNAVLAEIRIGMKMGTRTTFVKPVTKAYMNRT